MKNFNILKANRLQIIFCFMVFTLMLSFPVFSQNVGINSTGNPPNSSAGLDIDFPDKGLLIPRVSLTSSSSFAPLSAHVAGMVVYNTATASDVIPGFYYNDGAKWISGFPNGNAIGDMLYWTGSAWNLLPVGTAGQYLTLNASNIPNWAAPTSTGTFATLTTTAISVITTITATSGGTIVSDGGSNVLVKGVCWGTTTNPTTGNSITSNGSGNTTYTSSLTPLVAGTIYYVRAYSTNNSSVSYGNEVSFSTLATVSTAAATLITTNSARTGGTVTSGNAPVLERGVCYATTQTPTTSNIKVPSSPGTGAFICDITGLAENTLYYARAYVINASGTSYGTQISITTSATLTTAAITSITQIAASSGGTIAIGGNASITAKGVCWSTSPNPTTALTTKTSNGTGTAAFTSSLTPLIAGTTYYVRAYATNASGTWYGNELSFITSAPALATLTTNAAVTSITTTTATSGGNITNEGGVSVTENGVCWSTSPSPTIANSFYHYYTGAGAILGYLTGLTPNTLYYVRAYATNIVGTAYGNEVTFTTCATPMYTKGQQLFGGIILTVDCTGQHGLVMALADQGSAIWGCLGTPITTSAAVGTGSDNTTAIMNGCGTAGIAARLARSCTDGGFNDWYLPSYDELNLMVNSGYIYSGTYLSSTENNVNAAKSYYKGTSNWYSSQVQKGTAAQVRAIRSY